MNLQPILSNELVLIKPLEKEDFSALYAIASDKLLWEQHPNSDRYIKEVFEDFFQTAMASNGAFAIIDIASGKIIGSSRYYNLNLAESSVVIGFTFIGRNYWGTNYNRSIKDLMLKYAFQFIESVHFHVGKNNFRSQKAMEKLGAKLLHSKTSTIGVEENPVYEIKKETWNKV